MLTKFRSMGPSVPLAGKGSWNEHSLGCFVLRTQRVPSWPQTTHAPSPRPSRQPWRPGCSPQAPAVTPREA